MHSGKSYKQMLDAGGEVKALRSSWAPTWRQRTPGLDGTDKLDFLVVQELTETAAKADVVLPAVSWAEQDGAFTNLERRVQRAPKAGNPQSKAAGLDD